MTVSSLHMPLAHVGAFVFIFEIHPTQPPKLFHGFIPLPPAPNHSASAPALVIPPTPLRPPLFPLQVILPPFLLSSIHPSFYFIPTTTKTSNVL